MFGITGTLSPSLPIPDTCSYPNPGPSWSRAGGANYPALMYITRTVMPSQDLASAHDPHDTRAR